MAQSGELTGIAVLTARTRLADHTIDERRWRVHGRDSVLLDRHEHIPRLGLLEEDMASADSEHRKHEARRAVREWRRDEVHVARFEAEAGEDPFDLRVHASERLHDGLRHARAAPAERDDLRLFHPALDDSGTTPRPIGDE